MRILVVFLTLTFAAAAYAEDFDVTRLAAGETIDWQTHNGVTSLTYRGLTSKGYRFDFRRDRSKGSPDRAVFFTDRSGQLIRVEGRRSTTTFAPHDCSLTLGRCVYEERRSDNRVRNVIWNAEIKNGVWEYTMHHSKVATDTLLERGRFTADTSGVDVGRDYWNREGARFWTRRVRD